MLPTIIGLTVAIVFVLAGDQAARADETCNRAKFSYTFGVDTSTTIIVKQGHYCIDDWKPYLPGTQVNLKVVEKARHGFAGTSGATGYVYRPAKGYIGPDRFVVSMSSVPLPFLGSVTKVTVNVSVVP